MFEQVEERLDKLFADISSMRFAGLPVDCIPPMGAIYLTARFNLIGKTTPKGELIETNEDVRKYLLHTAGCAIVPFQAFDLREETGWFRISVGACSMEDIETMMQKVRQAIEVLK
jgi:aspartate aminotransferase